MGDGKPLCQLFVDDSGKRIPVTAELLVDALGLSRKRYLKAFENIVQYWNENFPKPEYLACAAASLNKIFKSPVEWAVGGRYLAFAASRTFANGSHQFVENAVPALIEGGLVQTPDELIYGIEIILENRFDKPEFALKNIETMIFEGRIRSLEFLKRNNNNATEIEHYHIYVENREANERLRRHEEGMKAFKVAYSPERW